MIGALSLAIAALALFISGLTAWLILLRRGTVRMTQPTMIFFGHDAGGFGPPKVYLRALLYPTAKRGRVIQSMHATLARNETRQTFNIWVYGDKNTRCFGEVASLSARPESSPIITSSCRAMLNFLLSRAFIGWRSSPKSSATRRRRLFGRKP